MKILILIMSIWLLSACAGVNHKMTKGLVDIRSDSIIYIETVKLDTVSFAKESFRMTIPEYLHDTVVVYRKGRASAQIKYVDGRKELTASCDSISEIVIGKDIQITNLKSRLTDKNRVIETEVKPPDRGGRWFFWIGMWASITVIAIKLINKYL